MAKAIAEKIISERGLDLSADSCGLMAAAGSPASENACIALQQLYDIDLSCHRAKAATLELLEKADIIFAMTPQHAYAFSNMPAIKEKVKIANPPISDPFMQDLSVYKKCAQELYQQISELICKEG